MWLSVVLGFKLVCIGVVLGFALVWLSMVVGFGLVWTTMLLDGAGLPVFAPGDTQCTRI